MHLLITGAWREAEQYLEQLKENGHEVCFMQQEKETLPCSAEWVEGVICNGLFLYHDIKQFKNLRYVQLTSAGYDRVSMEYLKEQAVSVYNARGVYSVPMAEFALTGVLQLYKRSAVFYENQKQHLWQKCRDLQELYGKNVCIVGCGSVGTECAKRFKAFGCKTVGLDLFPREDENYEVMYSLHETDAVLPTADILILTLPLTEETRHFMNEKRFALLKSGAVLVNIARGAVVDTKALLSALPHLGGAVLDVFEEEPLQESNALWQQENVILTPHNSFVGECNAVRLAQVILKNLQM